MKNLEITTQTAHFRILRKITCEMQLQSPSIQEVILKTCNAEMNNSAITTQTCTFQNTQNKNK